jgi:uncharacterized protein YcfJ
MNTVIKKIVIPAGVAIGLIASPLSFADRNSDRNPDQKYDRARVVDVQPIYESVRYEVPSEQCHQERVAVPRRHRASATTPIIGAILGGVLGNAVGHNKRNKQVGTVIGAVLGGSIGADIARRHHTNDRDDNRRERYQTQEVCETSYETRMENRVAGYNVSYVYAGTTYQTQMDRDPGDSIRVRVRVRPV